MILTRIFPGFAKFARLFLSLLCCLLITSFVSAKVPTNTSNDLLSAVQTMGFDHWDAGPFSFGGKYDTLLGPIFNGQYVQSLNEHWAIGGIGEYGPNQYRLNATLATQLSETTQAKVTAEYLSQVLPFKFDSGNIHQRVGQSAYGFELRQSFHQAFFQNLNAGGYWSNAPNQGLSSKIFSSNDLLYTNQRHLAGAISQGLNIGTEIGVTRLTLIQAKLFYDSVNYHTKFTSASNFNRSGGGGSLGLDQILTDQVNISVNAEKRAIYDTYSGEVNWQTLVAKSLGLEFSLIAQHLSSRNPTPSSNSIGLNISLSLDAKPSTENKTLATSQTLEALLPWVKTPAVYMQRVLVVAEQKNTLNGPAINTLSPSSGPFVGGNTIIIRGTNFLPGATVSFGGTEGAVTIVSPTELSVVVPALSLASTPASTTSSVDVIVTNPDGQRAVFSGAYTYTDANAPSISLISPNSGSTSGSNSITLTGTKLTGTSAVTFGGTAGTDLVVVNDTTVTVTTPAHAAGSVNVVLTTPEGNATSVDGYTYADPPTVTGVSPNSGYTTGGDTVTLTGTHFTDTSAVYFGSSAASYTINSDTSITATSPAGSAGVVNITVTTPTGTSTSSSADEFTYATPPHIIFVTTSSFNGNLGGFSGANTKCNSIGSGKPTSGFAADYTYKALLSGNNATINGVSYYRPDGTTLISIATGGNLVGAGSLTHSISTSSISEWTGGNGSNCNNWTYSGSSSPLGGIGQAQASNFSYWSNGSASCSNSSTYHLYCVSQ